MDTLIRAALVYAVVFLLFRLTGRRVLSEVTTFDFVLLLIIGEATQQALIGKNYSVTAGCIVVVTLLFLDVIASYLQHYFQPAKILISGLPIILVRDGQMRKERTDKARVDASEILESARRQRGLERLDQIKYAVLEQSGDITVIARESPAIPAEPAQHIAQTQPTEETT